MKYTPLFSWVWDGTKLHKGTTANGTIVAIAGRELENEWAAEVQRNEERYVTQAVEAEPKAETKAVPKTTTKKAK